MNENEFGHFHEQTRKIEFFEFSALKQDITDMKSLMSRMVEAMSRITIIEERQSALAQIAEKSLHRMEEITERQHQTEVTNAANSTMATRVDRLEAAVRESHIEGERNRARFDTIVWMVRGLWAVFGGAIVAYIVYGTQHISTIVK